MSRSRERTGSSRAIRSWIPPSTTGSDWPARWQTSRYRISRCATRASTCPTAGTIYKARLRPQESGEAMFGIIGARIRQGHRTMKYPDGPPPALPERFRGMPVHRSRSLRRRLQPVRGRLSDCRPSARRNRCGLIWADVSSAGTAPGNAPRARYGSAAIIAWRRDVAKPSSSAGRTTRISEPARCFRAQDVRPVAEAAPGERGRLQRLRGGRERIDDAGLGHRALRHPVRGVAAARRRAPDHGARDGEYEAGAGENVCGRAFSADRDRLGRLRDLGRPLPGSSGSPQRRGGGACRWTFSSRAVLPTP